MGRITKDMAEKAYEIGVKVYSGEIGRQEGKEIVNQATGMDLGSCNDYFTVLSAMLDGVEYHRTANAYATEYFLKNIEKDFGSERRKKAAYAVGEHAKYYATLGRGHQRTIEELAKKYM